MPSKGELIAHDRTVEQIASAIGADWLVFQDLDDLIDAVQKGNPDIASFDCSVFTGEYVTGGVTVDYLEHLEHLRSDTAKQKRRVSDHEVIELHNNA
jgi:amidophosphoribosyltransferase